MLKLAVNSKPLLVSCSIKIEQTTRHITVHHVYYPECDGEGEWLKYHSDSHCLVVGDFNQHSVLWEDGYTGREPKLGAGITGSDFVLLIEGTLTRVPDRSHDRGTAVDLALVTPDLVGDVEWSVGDDPLSSDHLPVTINITGTVMRERNAPHENCNYDKADWLGFRAELGALPIGDHGSLSIEALDSLFLENILIAARASIPTTKKGPPGPITTLGGAMPAGRRSKTNNFFFYSPCKIGSLEQFHRKFGR